MSCMNYEGLRAHIGHHIVCVFYGDGGEPENVALECEDCNEVLKSYDKPRKVKS